MRAWFLAVFLAVFPAPVAGCSAGVALPPQAAALNRAGVEALAAGDLETAEARFSVALEYSPRFVEALVNLGLVELERGNFARARLLCERARRLNPDIAEPHHALGLLAERIRRPDEASKHYYEALRVDPGFSPARENLARLLFRGGLVEEALVQYQRLVGVAPEDARATAGLAETLLRLGRHAEADALLDAALEHWPDSAELTILAARRALREGELESGIATLTPLAERHDELGATALAWLSVALLAQGNAESAVLRARRALELEPESHVATYALALALTALGSPEAAAWRARASTTRRDPPLAQGRLAGRPRGESDANPAPPARARRGL